MSTLLSAQSTRKADQALSEASSEEEALFVAKKAYEDGFYEVALNLFQRFLKKFPQSQKISEANLYISQCHFQKNRFVESLNCL